MEVVENKNNNLSKKNEAKDLINKSTDTISEKLKEKFNVSPDQGVELGISLIETIKEENHNVVEDYSEFCDSCDNAINTMQQSIKDNKLTNDEISNINLRIENIIKLANEARKENMAFYKDSRDKKLEIAEKVVKGGFALLALKMVLNAFKKN